MSSSSPMPRAILFDLDETLIDRTLSIERYAESIVADFAPRLETVDAAAVAKLIRAADGGGYRTREEVFALLAATLPWKSVVNPAEIGAHWGKYFPPSSVVRDGAIETLNTLRSAGIQMGIVTNGKVATQTAKIAHIGVAAYMTTVVISDALQIKKPDARIFRHALTEIACDACDAWFVGDHPINDVVGAASAGLIPIWLANVHPWPVEQPRPQRQITHLRELVTLVRQ